MKKYTFGIVAIMILFLSSCEMWHTDIVAFLDKYTNTAAIEKEDLVNGANYPVLNGVTHIPSDGDKVLRFTLRNPQSYNLIPSIENFPNFDVDGVDEPSAGVADPDYSLVQLEDKSIIELTFFEEYLRKLDEAGGGDLSATIRLVEEETGREFDSYSYELIANTAPIAPVEAVAAKADGIDTYVVVFDMGTQSEREGIHADISKIRINGTDYPVEVNRDTGAISIEGSSSLSTTLPEVSGVQASLVSLSGLEYVGSPDNSTIYFSTDYNHQNTSPTFEISFIDSMGLTSSSASVVTKGVLQTHYYVSNDLGGGLKTGSPANPFSNVQDAVNKILEIVDSSAKYTIHIGGNITPDADEESVSGMVVFDSSQALNLTLQGVSSGRKGTINPQNNKRGIYVNSNNVNLTLGDNLTITGGSADYGGGVYVERGTVNLTGVTITGNKSTTSYGGAGVYVEQGGTLNLSKNPQVSNNTSEGKANNIGMHENANVYITGELTGEDESIHITPPGVSHGAFYAVGKNYAVTTGDVERLKSDITFHDGVSEIGIILGVYDNNVFFSSLVYYVSRDGNNTSGVSEATAFHTVQPAIDRIIGTGGDRDFVVKIKGEVSGGSKGQYNSVFISSVNEVNVTLQGYSSSEKGIIQGDTTKTVLSISGENVYVTLGDNLTLKGAPSGTHHGGGAYINNGATFTMSGGEISGHTLLTDHNDDIRGGGGVYVRNGTFNMSGGEIKNNSAFNGGAVLVVEGTFNMNGGKIYNNTGSGGGSGGGAVFVYYGTDEESTTNKFTMTGGKIYDNQAAYGGAICVYDKSIVDLRGGDIYSNDAIAGFGGAVFMDDGSIANVSDTVDIYENTTVWSGGAIAVHGDRAVIGADSYVAEPCTLNMDGGTIRNNTANGNGGGVYVFGKAEFEMAGGTIENNIAKGSDGGGAIFTQGYVHSKLGVARANFIMSDGTILQNGVLEDGGEISTKYGGGVFVNNLSDMTMSGNASISGNKVSVNGGGLYVNDGATFTMENGTVLNNYAGKQGGGVYLDGTFNYTGGNTDVASTFTFNGGSINNNTVPNDNNFAYGGGIFIYPNAEFTLGDIVSGVTREIKGNSAYIGGGLFIQGNEVTLKNITISENEVAAGAGAIHVDDGTELTIQAGTVISDNTANDLEASNYKGGAAIFIDNDTVVNIEGGEITGNTSDNGAISFFGDDSSTLNLQGGVTILDNVSHDKSVEKNIVFNNSNKIKIAGSLSGEDRIGLTPTYGLASEGGVIARKGDSYAGLQSGDASAFFFDDGRSANISVVGDTLAAVELSDEPKIISGVWDGETGVRKVGFEGSGDIYFSIGLLPFLPQAPTSNDWHKSEGGEPLSFDLRSSSRTVRAVAVQGGKPPSNEVTKFFARAEKLTEPTINFELDEENETVTMKIGSVAGAIITARVSKTINGVSSVDTIDSVVGDNGFFAKTYDVEADGDTIEVEFAQASKDGMLTSDEAAAQRYTIPKLFLNMVVMQGGEEIVNGAAITFDNIAFSYSLAGGESVGDVSFTVRIESISGVAVTHVGVKPVDDVDISSFAGDSEITVSVKAMEKGFLGTDELVMIFRKFAIGDVGPAGGIIFSYDENTGIYKEVGEVISDSPVTYSDAGVMVATKELKEDINWDLPNQESLQAIGENLINNPAFSSKVDYLKDLTFITSTKNGDNRILVTLENGSATISEGPSNTITGSVVVIHKWISSQ